MGSISVLQKCEKKAKKKYYMGTVVGMFPIKFWE